MLLKTDDFIVKVGQHLSSFSSCAHQFSFNKSTIPNIVVLLMHLINFC